MPERDRPGVRRGLGPEGSGLADFPPVQAAVARTMAADLPAHGEGAVSISGWIHRRRRLKAVDFLILRDRTGLIQVVVGDDQQRAVLADLPEESVVRVDGTAVRHDAAPGGIEVTEPTITVLSAVSEPVAVELWRPHLDLQLATLLDHADVTLRHPARRAVFTLSAAALAGYRAALTAQGFTEISTPKIVANATESGANVFGIDYFGAEAFLAQSPQFYKQTMVGVFERVFEVGHVFRAEPHDTVRHLAEYTSLDAEMGFIADHRDVMSVATDVVHGMLAAVAAQPESVSAAAVTMPMAPPTFPSIHFADALALAGAATDEPDLAPDHERALGEWGRSEHGSDFVFVYGYPMRKRPFYTHPQPDDVRWSNSFDLLFRGLELVTGGQRLSRHEDYVRAIQARGERPEDYASYLAPFRHGMPPHGGFAFGLERFVARLVGLDNVREATLFPRDLHRLTP